MIRYVLLPIIGFLVGLLIISLGGGGGSIYVGVLTAFLNVTPAIAASTSLATAIPTTAVGAFSHWKAGNVNVKLGLVMLIGGIAGSIVGSLCSGLLETEVYYKITGGILLILAAQMAFTYIRRKRSGKSVAHDGKRTRADLVKAVCYGLIGGGMSGLVGLSGGGPIVAGLLVLGCSPLETVGTSVLVLLGISTTGFLMHLGFGVVDWGLVGLLAIGTVIGAFLSPILLSRADKAKTERVLQPILFIMITVMGVIIFMK